MGLVKKIKDILFEEEDYTEQIKIPEEKLEEAPKIVKLEPEQKEEIKEEKTEVTSERELFRSDNEFKFPDFDEEEFTSMARPRPKVNALEYERKKMVEKRNDFSRFERVESREYTEKKKFKPSPIISPVYGILNQDYKAEDIVNKNDVASNIDIEAVRKKAFEPVVKEEKVEEIDEPVVTFFEEKENIKASELAKEENFKTIDDLLEEASDEINLEDTLEIPVASNLDAIEEELEKLDIEEKSTQKNLEDTLDSDLFELIDSMYDEREEVE